MTDKQFYALWTEALVSEDRAAYVSDWCLSSIWDDDEGAEIPAGRVEQLGELWDMAHMSIREIREHTGLTQAAFSARHGIPKRTLENWEGGQRSCPDYVRLLLAQVSGAYCRG